MVITIRIYLYRPIAFGVIINFMNLFALLIIPFTTLPNTSV